MTKHTNNAVVTTSAVHGDELLPNRTNVPSTQPKPSGEHMAQGVIKRSRPGRKRKAAIADESRTPEQKAARRRQTKTEILLKKLRSAKGATITQLGEAIDWQAHSVRGFLSAVVRKKLGLTLVSEVGKDGVRRYRIDGDAGTAG